MQFQKFEPRFGGRNEPPEEQRNRRDLTIEDARRSSGCRTLAAAVSPERYLFGGGRRCRRGTRGGQRPAAWSAPTPDYSVANTHFVQDGRFLTDADVTHARAAWP